MEEIDAGVEHMQPLEPCRLAQRGIERARPSGMDVAGEQRSIDARSVLGTDPGIDVLGQQDEVQRDPMAGGKRAQFRPELALERRGYEQRRHGAADQRSSHGRAAA